MTSFLQANRSSNEYCKDRPSLCKRFKGHKLFTLLVVGILNWTLSCDYFQKCICNRLFMMDFISSMFCHEEKTTYSSYLLPSSSLFCLPHDSPVSLTDEVWRQGITTLFGKLEDWEDGKLMSQNNNLIGVWMPGKEVNSKGHLSWKLERDVFISSFL